MKYFAQFPSITYQLTESLTNPQQIARTVPNMTVKLELDIFSDTNLAYETYIIKDRDRPDTIAAQMYGSSRYTWVVMLANDMRDWYDWPLSDFEFDGFMSKKYESVAGALDGVDVAKATVYQYVWLCEDGQELIVDNATYITLLPLARQTISVYQQEYDENDRRRRIRLPQLDQLPIIVRQFSELMAQ